MTWQFDKMSNGCSILGFYAISDGVTPPVAYVAAESDARLIAAAPDLLQALKDVCESAGPAGWAHDSASSVIATKLIEVARAAILKAEGR